MRIGVVGYGFVGKAMCRFLERSHEIFVFDKYLPGLSCSEKSASINCCDLAFVCVPTPFDPEASSANMSAVSQTVGWLQVPMCIRSTVLPGTTKSLSARTGKEIAFSPEYLLTFA